MDTDIIPQADNLDDVARVVNAVEAGCTDDDSIANFLGKGTDRQGRYYRRAAEAIGLIVNNHNYSSLSDHGRTLAGLMRQNSNLIDTFIARRVLSNLAVATIFEFIMTHEGSDRGSLVRLLQDRFGGSAQTADRRITTIIQWLRRLALITDDGRRYGAIWRPAAVREDSMEFGVGEESDDVIRVLGSGLLTRSGPHTPELRELVSVWSGNRRLGASRPDYSFDAVEVLARQAAAEARTERASIEHQRLVSQMASLLRARDIVPQSNAHIDLFAQVRSDMYICEMKSCTVDNFISQARRGLAQLYEYRYMHQLSYAKLVLVLQHEPFPQFQWYVNYLMQDREILVCWPGSYGFECPAGCRHGLSKLLFE